MAWHSVSLDHNGGTGATYDALYINSSEMSVSGIAYYGIDYWATEQSSSSKITAIPVPSSPLRTFLGYYADGVTKALCDGSGNLYVDPENHYSLKGSVPSVITAKYEGPSVVATLNANGGTGGAEAVGYNATDGKWYLDYPFATELSASNPITVPTKTCYRFLGYYDTNGTTGNKCINADGTPTSYFLTTLAPTSDITLYAQWERVSYKVTVKHSSGSPTSTVFYAKIGETGSSRFYSDGLCTTSISAITPPQRELWRWNGAFSSSTQTSATQLIESDGTFTENLYDLQITANTTLNTANYWTQVSVKLTLSGSYWTIPTKTYYIDKANGGVYADWLLETTQLSALPIPVRAGYRFLGYYSSSTLYVASDGTIQTVLQQRKAATSISASGRAATYTLTLDPNCGTTTEGTIYYDATSGATAFFGASSAVITSVAIPTYTGNSFLGYYTEAQGGTQVIDASGNILSSWVPTEKATVYAHWGIDVSIIDVDAGEGSGGTSRFYHRTSTGKFYSDAELTTEITSISVPSLRLFSLNGLYTDAGVLAVNSSGVIQSNFNPTDEFVTLTATYTRFAYETILSGGVSSLSAIYRAPSGATWYSDLAMTTAVTNVGVPTKTGYTFGGYKYGGSTLVIDSSGNILSAAAVDEDFTASAQWTAKTYTLTFDGGGATPTFSSKSVSFGAAVGTLPTCSMDGMVFAGWKIDGNTITASTAWAYDANKTATVAWQSYFGDVTDYFGFGSASLIPISSDSGEAVNVQRVSHTGGYESGATEESCRLLNPTVTYAVVRTGGYTITLGQAFAAQRVGLVMNASGYMITEAECKTEVGKFPTITVRGTANEGADAINKFAAYFYVVARSKAQNIGSAIALNGCNLQSCTAVASCEPVVVFEGMNPCASDVVHGKLTVSATAVATTRAAINAGGPGAAQAYGYSSLGSRKQTSEQYYAAWEIAVEKGL